MFAALSFLVLWVNTAVSCTISFKTACYFIAAGIVIPPAIAFSAAPRMPAPNTTQFTDRNCTYAMQLFAFPEECARRRASSHAAAIDGFRDPDYAAAIAPSLLTITVHWPRTALWVPSSTIMMSFDTSALHLVGTTVHIYFLSQS